MKRFVSALFCAGLVLAAAGGLRSEETDMPELKKGDKAPDFELEGSDGKTYKLSDFKGKRAVVIAWFPKAFPGG